MEFTGVKDGTVEYLRVHIISGTFAPNQLPKGAFLGTNWGKIPEINLMKHRDGF